MEQQDIRTIHIIRGVDGCELSSFKNSENGMVDMVRSMSTRGKTFMNASKCRTQKGVHGVVSIADVFFLGLGRGNYHHLNLVLGFEL